MSSFLTDAERIFDVAQLGCEPEDFTIRISADNGIHIIAGCDYSASSGTTYHVRRGQGKVRVEGASGAQTCMLETKSYLPIFRDQPAYLMA